MKDTLLIGEKKSGKTALLINFISSRETSKPKLILNMKDEDLINKIETRNVKNTYIVSSVEGINNKISELRLKDNYNGEVIVIIDNLSTSEKYGDNYEVIKSVKNTYKEKVKFYVSASRCSEGKLNMEKIDRFVSSLGFKFSYRNVDVLYIEPSDEDDGTCRLVDYLTGVCVYYEDIKGIMQGVNL